MCFNGVSCDCALSTEQIKDGDEMAITPKAARVNAGLTQEQAAKALKIAKGTLASYEKGKTKPTIDMGKKIANLYGLKVDEISFCN